MLQSSISYDIDTQKNLLPNKNIRQKTFIQMLSFDNNVITQLSFFSLLRVRHSFIVSTQAVTAFSKVSAVRSVNRMLP